MISKSEMSKALKRLYATSPHTPLSESAIEEWQILFEAFNAKDFEAAFRLAKVSSGEFLPSPSTVMSELRNFKSNILTKQNKEWLDFDNGDVVLKITSDALDEKGKLSKKQMRYVDLSKDAKWAIRKSLFSQGNVMVLEKKSPANSQAYSYARWKEGDASSIYALGGYHTHNGENLPYLICL